MKTIYLGFLAIILFNQSLAQGTNFQDSIPTVQLEEVKIAGLRVDESQPFAYTNVKKQELKSRNLGQDLPIMLNYLPGVVTTSDAGSGIGYTGIRVRGSDASRVNITINGICFTIISIIVTENMRSTRNDMGDHLGERILCNGEAIEAIILC